MIALGNQKCIQVFATLSLLSFFAFSSGVEASAGAVIAPKGAGMSKLSTTNKQNFQIVGYGEAVRSESIMSYSDFTDPSVSLTGHHQTDLNVNYNIYTSLSMKEVSLSELLEDKRLKTRNDREIKIFVGRLKKKPSYRFLIQSGLHGDEIVAQRFVRWLASRYFRGESSLNEIGNPGSVAIDFLPLANPDGVLANSRNNAANVNLNRNFGTLWGLSKESPGARAFSEPETAAIRNLFEQRKYTAAVDIHGYVNWVVAPSDPRLVAKTRQVTARERQLYSMWMKSLRNNLHLLGTYSLKTAGGLGDGGAFEDWAFWQGNSLPFCLELQANRRWISQKVSPEISAQSLRNEGDYHISRRLRETVANRRNDKVDSYLLYEKYIHAMFSAAIRIRETRSVVSH